ncbi:MAG: MoaD/ThiS family protein [Flavobacteriaceae bacterium]|nr:MoaD/ThiS family protein [Flavobacteriaceae bacterium]
MYIKTLFFGILKDITNSNSLELEIDKDINIEQFVNVLQEKFKDFPNIDDFTVAVNEEYVERNFIIKENDIIAIIPPVSGG